MRYYCEKQLEMYHRKTNIYTPNCRNVVLEKSKNQNEKNK